ncbi:glycosyltransferase family A protein [Sphaerisporangium fuscum]|uniref:glycosyltransferase family A protein n=1 Tax=Sphaerisporangium fuscum TaxID=2835868 RepID=UPI001BDC5CD9|nr:glycosyltransferase family A protein [Sphaerisporangium fuscum]
MNEPPNHVYGLAEQRAKARAEHDFDTADVLRQEIEGAGWLVHDAVEGFQLVPKPPFKVWPTVAAIPASGGASTDDRGKPEAAAEAVQARHPGGRRLAAGGAAKTPGLGEDTEAETGTENIVAAQVLWDSTLSASRLDEAISAAATAQSHDEVASTVVTVALLVDGHPADLRKCLDALITHTDAKIMALDLGDVDGAGVVLHELAQRHPERVEAWHVAETPHWRGGTAGWGASRNKLLELDSADVHVVMETSTVLDGDAITPLAAALTGDVVAAGWKGVEPDEDGRDWHEAGPGEVRGLLGYLLAVRREAALRVGGFPEKARYYRNADLEFSLTLPGKVVVPDVGLPVHQERHRGYHDVDPGYRDRESRRTYERVLGLLRSGAHR